MSHLHPLGPVLRDLRFLRLAGGSYDRLGIVRVFGMLTEVGLDRLQDRRVRQGFDSRSERLFKFLGVEIAL